MGKGRRFVGTEIDGELVAAARRRVKAVQKQTAADRSRAKAAAGI